MRVHRYDTTDRLLAAVEIPALGLWFGALVAFAAFFAPAAFHSIAPLDISRFAALIAGQIELLTRLGYACGAIALGLALYRARNAGDRRWDLGRALVVVVALVVMTYHRVAIVPAMTAITDVTSPAYHALHSRSSGVYGAVVLLVLAALVLAAGQPGGER